MRKKELTVKIEYEQGFLPSARHKKPRRAVMSEDVVVSIKRPETAAEFPVAMIVSDYEARNEKFGLYKNTLRTLDGKLYSRGRYPGSRYEAATLDGIIWDIQKPGVSCYGAEELPKEPVLLANDKEERVREAKERAARYVLYKGEVWKECGEPLYVVMTFGLGHNHGGTSVMIHYGYNGNIPASRYFTALERDKAISCALKIAESRGDTKDYARIRKPGRSIRVVMTEMVKRNPAKDHGDGEPFLNETEEEIEDSDSMFEAGLRVIALASSKM